MISSKRPDKMSGHPSIPFLAGHCPLTGRYLNPSIGVERVVLCSHEVCHILFPGGGDPHMKQTGMLVGNFEFNP